MTNRIRRSFKINSMDSDYSELDETPTIEVQNQGQSATQLLNRFTCLYYGELHEIRVVICGFAFTIKQLIDATRKFSPKMELCRGPLGVLYKAELPNHVTVALEKICQHHSIDTDRIRRKVSVRKQLEHENIVKLFNGYSIKNLDLLIYEYMENGSLERALFDSCTRVKLNWETRFNVCLGVARGLRHLHDEITWFKGAHGSIQLSNIMLDSTLEAKLTDFGFEWLLFGDDDPSVKMESLSRMYMAPEYALGQPITPQADVYSFGIVLLEIVSGRCCVEFRPNQEAYYLLDAMLYLHAKGTPLELVDKRLKSSYNEDQAIIVINLAKKCVDHSPSLRPRMSDIVDVLEGEKTIRGHF